MQALGLIRGKKHVLSEITQITNIPKGTLRDLKKRGTGITKPRCGHPKKLTPRHIRHFEIYLRRNYSTRRAQIKDLIRIFHLDCTEKTVRKALYDIGYHHTVARRRFFLNKCDRKRWLQFAKRHAHWTVEDWELVIWTDETAVKLYIARQLKDFVWRRKTDEEFQPDCINYGKCPTGSGMMF